MAGWRMADPASVPAGKYGKAALTALGVWDSVAAKVVPAENVRVALEYVARGEAPYGIVYDTDAKVDAGVHVVGVFPGKQPPAHHLSGGADQNARRRRRKAFLAFLQGRESTRDFREGRASRCARLALRYTRPTRRRAFPAA